MSLHHFINGLKSGPLVLICWKIPGYIDFSECWWNHFVQIVFTVGRIQNTHLAGLWRDRLVWLNYISSIRVIKHTDSTLVTHMMCILCSSLCYFSARTASLFYSNQNTLHIVERLSKKSTCWQCGQLCFCTLLFKSWGSLLLCIYIKILHLYKNIYNVYNKYNMLICSLINISDYINVEKSFPASYFCGNHDTLYFSGFCD